MQVLPRAVMVPGSIYICKNDFPLKETRKKWLNKAPSHVGSPVTLFGSGDVAILFHPGTTSNLCGSIPLAKLCNGGVSQPQANPNMVPLLYHQKKNGLNMDPEEMNPEESNFPGKSQDLSCHFKKPLKPLLLCFWISCQASGSPR